MEPKVFISYSSKDADAVKRITDVLTDSQITYWKAPEMIPAGSNYAREIPNAIIQSAAFLLMVSADSQSSIWVQKELDCAINNKVTVVPVLLDGNPISEMFRFYLNNVQIIDYSKHQKDACKQLTDCLRSLVSSYQTNKSCDPALPLKIRAGKEESDRRNRNSVFDYNQNPTACEYCGFELRKIGEGQYQCKRCGKNSYDTFHKIKNYLEKHGTRTITQIARDTGIPKSYVEYFLKEGRLEVANASVLFLRCERCGVKIRTGKMCEYCRHRIM